MILILGEKQNLTLEAFARYSANLGIESIWLDASDIVNNLVVDDEIEPSGEVKIRWTINGLNITPANTFGVFNMSESWSAFSLFQYDCKR